MDRDEVRGRLGYARPSWARAMVRTNEFFLDVSADTGDWWWDLRRGCEASAVSDWRRVSRRHMEDAAIELLDALRVLPRSVLQVVEMRALGMSWTRISKALPDRAYFSILDDWKHALRYVGERYDDLVRRLN